MKKLPLITLACALPFTVIAQDSDQTARDRSMIVGFLEDNLSGAGRDIRIEGFKGVLSSSATMERLTIADEDGIWFTLKDAELDWNRKALLKKRVEITRISAGEIIMERLPDTTTEKDAPKAEASAFSLPTLPVSISIGEIAAERVELGAPVLKLGESVVLSLQGHAKLADGSGDAQLDITRLDAAEGAFNIDASFDNTTEVLDLDLSLTEGAGGIVTTMINIPGAPELALTAKGAGPLDNFTADIALATHGKDRLTGTVALQSDADPDMPNTAAPRVFTADLSGDLTPLFSAEYARFFGEHSSLRTMGTSYPTGAFDLERFALSTEALSLVGSTSLGSDGMPTAFALSGGLKSPENHPALLPFGSARASLESAQIIANYDASKGESWSALIDAKGYRQDGLRFNAALLDASGSLAREREATGLGWLGTLSATVNTTLRGLEMDDAALSEAIGTAPRIETRLQWRQGTPLLLENLKATTDATILTADGTIDGFEAGFKFIGNFGLDTPSLARFARLAGRPLGGGISAKGTGEITPLGGMFDLSAEAIGQNLRLGMAQVDPLIAGRSTLALAAKRDETGLTLKTADLRTGAIIAAAKGNLSTESAALDLNAALDNVSRLGIDLSGPLTVGANLRRSGANAAWQTEADLTGPGGSSARLSGSVAQDAKTANLALKGTAPLGLANAFTDAALIHGTAGYDLTLNGPLALSSLNGQLQMDGTRLVVTNPAMALTLTQARVQMAGEAARIEITSNADRGGTITTSGTLGLSGAMQNNLALRLTDLALSDPALYSTTVSGDLAINGPLTGATAISGALTLGETNIVVNPSGLGAGGDLLDVTHVGETAAQRQTRVRAGAVSEESDTKSTSPGLPLNITVTAPGRIFVRGRGLDAELGGKVQLKGSSRDIQPVGQFSLIRGRLSLLGQRIDMSEGTLTMQGDLDPSLRLVGETEANDIVVQLILAGRISAPDLTLTSAPSLPEEEILSQLLFGRDMSEISALQAAQMASAIATLTGSGNDIVGNIRDSFGLDDLDFKTSEDGTSALKVGKYLSEKVYTDVTIDQDGKSVINLNLDATDNITIKGSAGSDGETGIGVFFEKDY